MNKSALSGCALLLVSVVFSQIDEPSNARWLDSPQHEIQKIKKSRDNSLASSLEEPDTNILLLGGETFDDRVTVGIGTKYPNSLATLELGDIDKGLLINRLSTEQAEMFEMALGMGDEGMMIYNLDKHNLQFWNGIRWVNAGTHNLELNDDVLRLEQGTEVNLSKYANTDQQNLTSATLQGKNLRIEIEDGDPVSVDLSPLFAQYDERIRKLEEIAAQNIAGEERLEVAPDLPILIQNFPNPTNDGTSIKYYIPFYATSAKLIVRNASGQMILSRELDEAGNFGEERISTASLPSGVYFYTLFVNQSRIETKKMMVE